MWSDFCKHMVLERLEECCLVRGRMIFSQAYTPIKHVRPVHSICRFTLIDFAGAEYEPAI